MLARRLSEVRSSEVSRGKGRRVGNLVFSFTLLFEVTIRHMEDWTYLGPK